MEVKAKLFELLETVPHHQRLYPDLYIDMLIENGVTVQEHARWVLWTKEYGGQIIGYEWHCSNCNFVAHSWSGYVDKCRNGIPYKKPNWACCPKCKRVMDED